MTSWPFGFWRMVLMSAGSAATSPLELPTTGAANPTPPTPTCVRNTHHLPTLLRYKTVHPHVCGEYDLNNGQLDTRYGSPPRVWGIRNLSAQSLPSVRFTPTCVGNTSPPPAKFRFPPVHPHVCGEYLTLAMSRAMLSGSPPRVWGIPDFPAAICRSARFTPTCVGNTRKHGGNSTLHTVHPHVCGEYST